MTSDRERTGGRAGRRNPTWDLATLDALRTLIDRQIVDADGMSLARVDDVELELHEDGAPTISALLCGTLALGPRLGGRLGVWWSAVGRRLRGQDDPRPVRIDFDHVATLKPTELRLDLTEPDAPPFALRIWTREKIVTRLPGGTR